jgi:hypothetical protein
MRFLPDNTAAGRTMRNAEVPRSETAGQSLAAALPRTLGAGAGAVPERANQTQGVPQRGVAGSLGQTPLVVAASTRRRRRLVARAPVVTAGTASRIGERRWRDRYGERAHGEHHRTHTPDACHGGSFLSADSPAAPAPQPGEARLTATVSHSLGQVSRSLRRRGRSRISACGWLPPCPTQSVPAV